MTPERKAAALAAIERAKKIKYIVCPECEGNGLMIVDFDFNVYENVEALCDRCNRTGFLKDEKGEGLFPELVELLTEAMAENEREHSKVMWLQGRLQKICEVYEYDRDIADEPMDPKDLAEHIHGWAHYGLHPSGGDEVYKIEVEE